MVRVCGNSFEKYRQVVIDRAVGGGIVCSLGEESLRRFLEDTSITFKPHQDVIVQALDECRRNTEAAVAALEESGSPYTFTVVRALRTHSAAYVTFTKVGVYCMVMSVGVVLALVIRMARSCVPFLSQSVVKEYTKHTKNATQASYSTAKCYLRRGWISQGAIEAPRGGRQGVGRGRNMTRT